MDDFYKILLDHHVPWWVAAVIIFFGFTAKSAVSGTVSVLQRARLVKSVNEAREKLTKDQANLLATLMRRLESNEHEIASVKASVADCEARHRECEGQYKQLTDKFLALAARVGLA